MGLEFNLKPTSIPVAINGPKGKEVLELREMTAANRDKHMDDLKTRVILGPDGKGIGISRYTGLQADLVALCLYRSPDQLVPQEEIQTWPSSVVEALYREAQKLNKIGEEVKEVLNEVKKA